MREKVSRCIRHFTPGHKTMAASISLNPTATISAPARVATSESRVVQWVLIVVAALPS